MVKRNKGPDHIREHLEKNGHKHQFVNYAQGVHYYDLPCSVKLNPLVILKNTRLHGT